MATTEQHYAEVLADIYSWMLGGFDHALKSNAEFFKQHNISPCKSGQAIDLGAGCGFQSIPLAELGFDVTAIDLDRKLLEELKAHGDDLAIKIIQDNLINFEQHTNTQAELIICMTDTLIHLGSKDEVSSLLQKIFLALEDQGKFIITFRDLSQELSELERFIPVTSDNQRILTCFLEYEPDTVKVHDLLYQKNRDGWQLNKSYYRKLRLSKQWVDNQLEDKGFSIIDSNISSGLVTIIATK